MDFQGSMQKNSRGFTINLTGNPRESTSKTSTSSTGGVQFFSGKARSSDGWNSIKNYIFDIGLGVIKADGCENMTL